MSTPPIFPQDQTEQTPSNPATPADPSAIPPDTKAPEGNFILADNSGNSFQLQGDAMRLKGYIGKEVQIEGIATSNSGAPASAMASPTSAESSCSSSGAATQLRVSKVHRVADTCVTGSGTNK